MAVIKQAPRYRYTAGYTPGLVGPSKDMMGVEVKALAATLLAGDNQGEEVQELKANQLASIKAPVGPRKYNALAGYNPKLAELAEVSMNPVLEDGDQLELIIRARKSFKLADLDYVFRMFVIE